MRIEPIGKPSLFSVFFLWLLLFSGVAAAGRVTVQNGQLNVTDSLGSSALFVNSTSGKVGINTSSPNATLSVVGGSSGFGGDSVYDVVQNGTTYRVHVFTTIGNSTFIPPAGVTSVEYLVVAGGGGGGGIIGGGGGAGGFRNGTLAVTTQAYNVTVGAGGTGGAGNYIYSYSFGTAGGSSAFYDITSAGGAGAPSYRSGGTTLVNGTAGGSGSGAASPETGEAYSNFGGAGNTPSTSPSQGNSGGGGFSQNTLGNVRYGGGGGGAGGIGENGSLTINRGGNGGAGLVSSITGFEVAYSGGGGGGANNVNNATAGAGGIGGGGNGSLISAGTDGTPSSGGGGGGGGAILTSGVWYGAGGNGGSGIVVVRYPYSGPALRVDGSSFFNSSVSVGTQASGATLHAAPSIRLFQSGGSGGDSIYDIVDNGVAYRVHKFTTVGSGTFTPPAGVTQVEYLVVGGGGSGGSGTLTSNLGGGGGGAGGFRTGTLAVSNQAYPVLVGAGGVTRYGDLISQNGSKSQFASINATGGGGGGIRNANQSGQNGGSGGGSSALAVAGLGNAGGYVPVEGYGGSVGGYGVNNGAGGGGGASAAGGVVDVPTIGYAGPGGAGAASSITGTLIFYAGGGGGGVGDGQTGATRPAAPGGIGGGGSGGLWSSAVDPQAGVNGTGGGGGGAGGLSTQNGGSGGSGIVVIRYPLYATTLRADGISFFNGSVGIGTSAPSAKIHVLSGPMATGGDSVYEIVQNGVAYRVHKFTTVGNSTFTPPAGLTSVEYLVVAGGGGGATTHAGGGGAGGFLTGNTPISGTVNVTVGGGGNYGANVGYNGVNSSFGSIVSVGGGGGGGANNNGSAGGSGGGAGRPGLYGGAGTSGQGTNGGNTYPRDSSWYGGAGGGGAGHVGYALPSTNNGGNGGEGLLSVITGTTVWYAGGGGGNAYNSVGGYGVGGIGGGGRGGNYASVVSEDLSGMDGIPNTGGGGGAGAGNNPGVTHPGAGGSGIVVVRYPISSPAAVFQGSVGIGTTNPQAALHVAGNALFTGDINVTGTIYASNSCPAGMVLIPGDQQYCIDRYEAYNAGGTVYNTACTTGSQAEVDFSNTTVVAGSAPGQIPLTSINWCAAKKACQNAGKHLCTNMEWFQACNYKGSQWSITAEQTAETMGCNTGGSAANLTGASPGCVTQEGAYDLIGNTWEWVDKVVTADPTNGVAGGYITGYDFSTGLPTSTGSTSNAYGNDYFYPYDGAGAARAFVRGGAWNYGANTGAFNLILMYTPLTVHPAVGFRCCK